MWHGRPVCAWSDCRCTDAYASRSQALTARSDALRTAAGTRSDLGPLTALAATPFDRERLTPPQVLDRVMAWIEAALDAGDAAPSYSASPAPCLYFYSPNPGAGKSHLAAIVAARAVVAGRLVAVADEVDYLERYWAASPEARQPLSDLPGRRAWLTVLDDLGRRQSRTAGLRDAWHDVINPRWYAKGWTIVTSNVTPDELLAQGTLSDATYSRLLQLTQRRIITFGGADQRLGGAS